MNETNLNPKGFTLDELLERKEETRKAIAEQEQHITQTYRQLLSPVTNIKSISGYIGRRILSGFTIFESTLWSYRIITRLFRIFRRRR